LPAELSGPLLVDPLLNGVGTKARGRHSPKLSGAYVDPSRRTFGDYASSWLTTKVDETRTRINVEGRLQNHILPVLGTIPLASIRPEDVRMLVAAMVTEKRLAPSTVKAVYLTTSQVLETGDRRPDRS
jgi:Phage integrase, N-terminal SAM-like domain